MADIEESLRPGDGSLIRRPDGTPVLEVRLLAPLRDDERRALGALAALLRGGAVAAPVGTAEGTPASWWCAVCGTPGPLGRVCVTCGGSARTSVPPAPPAVSDG